MIFSAEVRCTQKLIIFHYNRYVSGFKLWVQMILFLKMSIFIEFHNVAFKWFEKPFQSNKLLHANISMMPERIILFLNWSIRAIRELFAHFLKQMSSFLHIICRFHSKILSKVFRIKISMKGFCPTLCTSLLATAQRLWIDVSCLIKRIVI